MPGSSCSEEFCKTSVLENLAKFVGKRLCRNFFFNIAAGLRTATLLKKRVRHRFFPVNFLKFLKTAFL